MIPPEEIPGVILAETLAEILEAIPEEIPGRAKLPMPARVIMESATRRKY